MNKLPRNTFMKPVDYDSSSIPFDKFHFIDFSEVKDLARDTTFLPEMSLVK
ncbi:conserved hypothetical protein [Ricinus communis]|uniref:Uncharacterized protein n=1 Tax=Ricinus communis TaxID=3988 RepID=B9SEV9_RICCO|nr:conserved hypothetical protein [Ricinus communis]